MNGSYPAEIDAEADAELESSSRPFDPECLVSLENEGRVEEALRIHNAHSPNADKRCSGPFLHIKSWQSVSPAEISVPCW